jgi:hypothetical protein
MIQIRATSEEIELSGTPSDLQRVRNEIEAAILNAERTLSIAADPEIDPTPYASALVELRVIRSHGPTKVSVEDQTLVVAGADENLMRFSTWFTFAPDAEPGIHSHFDFLPGDPYVDSDSRSLVVSVSAAAQQTAARDRAKRGA